VRGYDLVALIFVRENNDPLTSLVKRIDKELLEVSAGRTGTNRGVFVIYCNSSPSINDQLKALVAQENLKQIVLFSTTAEGPKRYNLAKDADMTVVVYDGERTVTSNHALKPGELNEAKADAIVKSIVAMLRK
jgi:hypothetical protein